MITCSLLLVLFSSCSATAAPFEATLLRADGTNLNEDFVPQYALASTRPTLHWSISVSDLSKRGLTPKSYVLTLHDLSADPLKSKPSFVSHVIHSSSTTHLWSNHQDLPVLTSGTLYEWHVSGTLSNNDTYVSQPGRFRISLLKDQAWHNVSWLGSNDFNVYQTQFHVGATKPLDAALYIAGLGYSNVMLNGKPIGKSHLVTAPWTANERLVGFSALDVTANLLANQVNSLTVMLGNGWREQSDFPYGDHELGDDSVQKVLRAQLYFGSASSTKPITYTGDGTWTAAVGPSTYDSVYNGETFNATLMSRLMTAALNDTSTWQSAPQTKGPRGKMIPWSAPQVEITQEIKPISVHSPAPHVFVFDFGVNLAGVVRLNKLVNCKENERIILQHAEIMQHAGIPGLNHSNPNYIYTGNLRSAKATDQYICNGNEAEDESFEWYPRLTYHGFRFVQINTSLAENVKLDLTSVHLLHFHSAVVQRTNASFPQSPTLNTIQTMALGAQRSNFMTVPTDCDQRDERLGWMGDASLSGDSMALNFNVLSFLQFYVQNIVSEINSKDGSLTDTVPFVRYGGRPGDVSWTGAFVNLMHVCDAIFNDQKLIQQYLNQAVSNLNNIKTQAKNGLDQMHTPYGDWCPPPVIVGGGQGPKPSSPYTSAFSYLKMIRQVHDFAERMGNKTLMKELDQLNQSVTEEFNNVFSNETTNCYDGCKTQTGLVLALSLDLAGATTPQTQSLLIHDITAHQNHYTTGIIGQKFLYDELKRAGKEDLSLTLLENVDYPSIGYYFANTLEAATTNLWELPDAPFEGIGMNSRNHHMWSSYSAYLVRSVAGLDRRTDGGSVMHYHMRPASVERLFASSVEMLEPSGLVSLSFINHGGSQSRKVAAASNEPLLLDCGSNGGVVKSIDYISYGTSLEQNNLFVEDSICHSTHTTNNTHLIEQCIGQQTCLFGLKQDLYNPLPEVCHRDLTRPLTLWVQATCTRPLSIEIQVEVPVGSVASIDVPSYRWQQNNDIQVVESGVALNGATPLSYQPTGIFTIDNQKDHAQRDIIRVEIGSGKYHFIASVKNKF